MWKAGCSDKLERSCSPLAFFFQKFTFFQPAQEECHSSKTPMCTALWQPANKSAALWQRKRAQSCDSSGGDSAKAMATDRVAITFTKMCTTVLHQCEHGCLSAVSCHQCHTSVHRCCIVVSLHRWHTNVAVIAVTVLSRPLLSHQSYVHRWHNTVTTTKVTLGKQQCDNSLNLNRCATSVGFLLCNTIFSGGHFRPVGAGQAFAPFARPAYASEERL